MIVDAVPKSIPEAITAADELLTPLTLMVTVVPSVIGVIQASKETSYLAFGDKIYPYWSPA